MSAKFVFLLLLIPTIVCGSTESTYPTPDFRELKTVIKIRDNGSYHNIVRLYKDGIYEYLEISQTDGLEAKELGNYIEENNTIQFNDPTITGKGFHLKFKKGKYYKTNSGLYGRKIDFLLNRKADYTIYKTKKYGFPWFFVSEDRLGRSKEILPESDLKLMVEYILKDLNSDKEKFRALADFVVDNIEYGNSETKESDYERILFGRKKTAVCEGYSRTYQKLCELAELESRYVSGPVRDSYAELFYLQLLHAWNHIKINGNWHAVDVTWLEASDFWFMPDYNDFKLSHMEDSPDIRLDTFTVDEFAEYPIVSFPKKGIFEALKNVSATSPIQYSSDTFLLELQGSLKATEFSKSHPDAMYTYFLGEKTNPNYKTDKIKPIEKTTDGKKQYLFILNDTVNLISININGIGQIDYLIVKGDKEVLLEWMMNHWNPKSTMSTTYALIGSLLLNNKVMFEKIKGNTEGQNFKEAKKSITTELPDWNMLIYSCSSTIGKRDDNMTLHGSDIDKNGLEMQMLRDASGNHFFLKFRRGLFAQFAKN